MKKTTGFWKKNIKCLMTVMLSVSLAGGGMQSVFAGRSQSDIFPDNITIETPMELGDISLPECEYGILRWAQESYVPDERWAVCEVVLEPYADVALSVLEEFDGWDEEEGVLNGEITIIVTSFSEENDYEEDTEGEDYLEENSRTDTEGNEAEESTDIENVTDMEGENSPEENSRTDTEGNEAEENTGTEDVTDTEGEDSPEENGQTDAEGNGAEENTGTEDVTDTEGKDSPEKNSQTDAEGNEAEENPGTENVTDKKGEDSLEENNQTDAEGNPEENSQTNPEGDEIEELPEDSDIADVEEVPEDEDITDAEPDEPNIFERPPVNPEDDARSEIVDEELTEQEMQAIAEQNHTCDGISVFGIDLPWYVQFRATSGEQYRFENQADSTVFKAYEFELWDLKNQTEYSIPEGSYISVVMPVIEGYEYTVEHLLDNGAIETIIPSVNGSTLIFSTHSFSPFGIAGSNPIIGSGVLEGVYQDPTPTPANQNKVTPTPSQNGSSVSGGQSNNSGNGTSSSGNAGTQNGNPSNGSSSSQTQQKSFKTARSGRVVNTGDVTIILPFVIMVLLAAIMIVVIVVIKRNRR